jgi:hypothetical protein
MACTITQADLGPLFADVDPALFASVLASVTAVVLGLGGVKEAAWICCDLDPCEAVKLLTQHVLAMTPKAQGGAGLVIVTSEREGDVAASYGNADSTSGAYGGTVWGRMYATQLNAFELCQGERNSVPFAAGGGSGGCGCL